MTIQRIDELASPPVVGRYYLVPTVTASWYGDVMAWPVIGPRHSDAQCLKFDHQHYHLDARFLTAPRQTSDFWVAAFAAPLMTSPAINPEGLPAPVWLRRKCRRAVNPELDALRETVRNSDRWQCHFAQWEGKQARHDGRGWVCPHRSVQLAAHAAVHGVVTCPLHLLRIDAATGIVLPEGGSS